MAQPTLSRSSRLYKFVFGHEDGKLNGFPEPRSNRISLGTFVGLLLASILLRTWVAFFFLMMDVFFRIIGFLVDGSYVRGSVLKEIKIIKIMPWPSVFGRRVAPWFVLMPVVVFCQYWRSGMGDATETALGLGFMTFIFWTIQPGDKSPSMELAEKVGPILDQKLSLSYYREPKLFPTLYLVN